MKEIGSIFPLYSEDIALKGIQPTNEQRSDIRINYSLFDIAVSQIPSS
jgi:hypothetical protein